VRLRGAADAVTNARRGALDGDGDGTAGGDLLHVLATAAPPSVRLRLPDFARGPGQAVAVPNTNAGLPITLATDGSAKTVSFRLRYDAALLALDPLAPLKRGNDLPAGAVVTVDPGADYLDVQITSGTAFAAGNRQLLNLVATVRNEALMRAAGAVRLEDVVIDGVAVPLAADAAVQFVGYVGDVNFDGAYTTDDVTKIQRLVVRADTWLEGAPNVDSTVIADVDGNGVLTTLDAAYVAQRRAVGQTPMIPAIPPVPLVAAPTSSAVSASASTADVRAASSTGTGKSPTVNLGGSFSNFSLPTTSATLSASLPTQLKILRSAVSEGAQA